jgi:hypothetical protein
LVRLPVLKAEELKEQHHLQVAVRDVVVAKDARTTVEAVAKDVVAVITVGEVRIVAADQVVKTVADKEARIAAVTQLVQVDSEVRNN